VWSPVESTDSKTTGFYALLYFVSTSRVLHFGHLHEHIPCMRLGADITCENSNS
jgi:hypothetical protein